MTELTQRVDRLNETQRKALLQRLDEMDPVPSAHNRRGMPRMPFRRTHVAVTITQPAGGTISCTVPTRDLSAGGLSFIYWGFLYKGSHIQCILTRTGGAADLIESQVTWCKLLGGGNHLIGVRFRDAIQPELYLTLQDGPVRAKAFDPRNLTGKVLVVTSNALERNLLSHYLKQTQIEFVCVDQPDLAVEICSRQTFDLLLCDLDFDGNEAERAIVAMRMGGFDGSLLALTAESDLGSHKKSREAGAAAILRKPLAEDTFLHEIARWLNCGRHGEDGPLYSELTGRGLDDLIGQFVEQCRFATQQLRDQLAKEDLPGLRATANLIRGHGASYGFPAASEAAAHAVTAIDAANSIVEVSSSVTKLTHVLARLASPPVAHAA